MMAAPWIARVGRWLAPTMALMVALAVVPAASSSSAGAAPLGRVTPSLLARAGTSNVLYVLGTTGCDTARCARLYRSNLDVTHFKRVSLPPLKTERGGVADSTLEKLVFANPRDGFAFVGYGDFGVSMYATSNGARTWREVERVKKGQLEMYVSSSQIFVTSVHCVPRTMNCTQFVTQRSNLAARHWVSVPRLWKTGIGSNDIYYGPAIASYGNEVWELESGPDYWWTSHNDGRTFTKSRLTFPQLVSVSGCSLYPKTPLLLWAECPTGMQVSFWHTSDGGAVWSPVSQSQFSGTGGGAFAPVTQTVAYLDYGGVQGKGNIVRLSDSGRSAQVIGELNCTDATLLFTSIRHGLAVCTDNYTEYSLRQTNDGGATWNRVSLPRT
jgi:hypothetical protein